MDIKTKRNGSEIAVAAAGRANRPVSETRDIMKAVFDEIVASLARGEEVRISGFGRFGARRLTGKMAKNPRTGERVPMPQRKKISFAASERMREKVNQR